MAKAVRFVTVTLAVCAIIRSIIHSGPIFYAMYKISSLTDLRTHELPDPKYFGPSEQGLVQDINELVQKMAELKEAVEQYSM